MIAQFAAARERVVGAGLLAGPEFDADLEAIRAEPPVEQFRTNSRIVVIGSVPERLDDPAPDRQAAIPHRAA